MSRRSARHASTAAVVETREIETEANGTIGSTKAPSKSKVTKRKITQVVVEEERETPIVEKGAPAVEEAKPKKKRKSAKEKAEEAIPLAKRTAVSSLKKSMYIGAHVSSAGGVHNSINNAVHIGANSFALFLKSQRKWANPPIQPEARDQFHALSRLHSFEVHKHCVPHGSYLVNLAQQDEEKAGQAYNAFLDDLERCESLGIKLYNFHPGNTNGQDRAEAIRRIATQLNKSHKATSTVITLLENMAVQGNVIGSTFEDLRDIIELIDDKRRVGVCIDTCHAFAAGYDLRTPEAFKDTVDKLEKVVGLKYLKAFHINDSKAPFNSHRDLHANIGTGFLGLRAFHNVMNHEPFQHIPMVLETPIERTGPDGKSFEDKQVWADEIKLLESLIGMDPESDEFKAHDERLQAQGASERTKLQDQVDRKAEKDAKKGTKRSKKKVASSDEDESD
ncbi:hypothetical protein DL768_000942 [Monosporascus sp. mg162]|nr:hypothetical protein DL768_000942 [Monosporascus sp. mg162]